MPWAPRDARRHTGKAKSKVSQRQWSHAADSVLAKTGDERLAIIEANGVIKDRSAKATLHRVLKQHTK